MSVHMVYQTEAVKYRPFGMVLAGQWFKFKQSDGFICQKTGADSYITIAGDGELRARYQRCMEEQVAMLQEPYICIELKYLQVTPEVTT